jgi:hypothetical protein
MTERPINLRRHRKQMQRETTRAEADSNAARHSLSKFERKLFTAQNTLDDSRLDGHRLNGHQIEDTDEQG